MELVSSSGPTPRAKPGLETGRRRAARTKWRQETATFLIYCIRPRLYYCKVYRSQTGNQQYIADGLKEVAEEKGFSCSVHCTNEFAKDKVSKSMSRGSAVPGVPLPIGLCLLEGQLCVRAGLCAYMRTCGTACGIR